MNNNNVVIGYIHLSKGGVTGTVLDVEEIVGVAAKSLAKSVIVAHNHPSGTTKPSEADIQISRKLRDALKFIEVKLLDSIILTPPSELFVDGEYTSLADEGII